LRSGAVSKRVGRGEERIYSCRESVRVKPGFSETEQVDFVVMDDVLEEFRFVTLVGYR
jgi:hypothetical protein